jgi:phosphatidylglycerophosphatase A
VSGRDRIVLFLAEGFGLGRLPFAPGTFGSALGAVLAYPVVHLPLPFYVMIVVGSSLGAVWVGTEGERVLGRKDPGQIVIDEIVAMPIACLPVLLAPTLPPVFWSSGWFLTIVCFAVFRVFDIAKPWPINISQRLPRGWGLVVDDILAAIWTAVLVWAVYRYFLS